jgi:NAD(P)-dependent dehydrogenase (short-subunit alcohol dehydrogenase family)
VGGEPLDQRDRVLVGGNRRLRFGESDGELGDRAAIPADRELRKPLIAFEGDGWPSVYGATKHAAVDFTEAMNRELANAGAGIRSTGLCPAFVDTPMSDWVKDAVPGQEMSTTQNIAESVCYRLKLSPT